jgi:hypothetical protein
MLWMLMTFGLSSNALSKAEPSEARGKRQLVRHKTW